MRIVIDNRLFKHTIEEIVSVLRSEQFGNINLGT